ncbi:MAG: peptidase, partial [Pseudomonadales bacterium]
IEPHIVDSVLDINGKEIFKARHPIVCDHCNEAGADQGSAHSDSESDLTSGEPATLEELFATETEDSAGEDAAYLPPLIATRVVDERNAFVMHSMLRDVIRRGTGVRAARALGRGDIAGKTGTTNDAADTWFNGYHPDLVTTVWVGFPNHQPLGANEYGSNRPLPIWIDYMSKALEGMPESYPDQPSGVVTRKIDPKTGELATARDKGAIFEYFLEEHVPLQAATRTSKDPESDDELKAVDIF